MASQYSSEQKAQVLALVRQGEPADRPGAACGVPARTAQLWAKRFREIAAEQGDREIIDEDYRLALRSSQLIHDAYDSIEEEGTAASHLIALNAIRGTAIDKLLKRNQGNTGSGSFVIVRTSDGTVIEVGSIRRIESDLAKEFPDTATPSREAGRSGVRPRRVLGQRLTAGRLSRTSPGSQTASASSASRSRGWQRSPASAAGR